MSATDRTLKLDARWLRRAGVSLAVLWLAGCQTGAQLHTLTLPEAAEALAAGTLDSVELVRAYQARISRYDRAGPRLQSVIALNPAALADAERLDRERDLGQVRGPLHGLPILLKDNIESQDPVPTTAGSEALVANYAAADAPLVARLRAAGAVVLGKANLSEWANFRSYHSSSGWSAVGGQTRNPHALDRNPCGSSSGSGVAVAAAFAAAAIGTETNGSIICPAMSNGVVGVKPTVGLISQHGIVPISHSQDTAGPMTRTVRGAAMLMDALTADSRFLAAVDAASLDGLRIGVLGFAVGTHPDVLASFEAALAVLEGGGAELVQIEAAPDLPADFRALAEAVLLHEFKTGINRYLGGTPPEVTVRSLAELIVFNEAAAGTELALFDQSIFETAHATGGTADPEYQSALASVQQATRAAGIDRLLEAHGVTLLIAPSGPPAPLLDAVNGDVWPDGTSFGWAAAIAGYPHVTVPMGHAHGLPLGLSFIGTKDQDAALLGAAAAFEAAGGLRLAPRFLERVTARPELRAALDRDPPR